MSKRALKKYLTGLKKQELEEQMLDLYDRFPAVKQYYDFVFNPREDKWIQEAKVKISNEYFPLKRKKARARRSVAQKYIKQFLKLGMAPHLIADVMLYNLEVAQSFSKERNVPDTFYKSMLNSFTQLIQHVSLYGMLPEFKDRIIKVYNATLEQNWEYSEGFTRALDIID
ncbi:MAG: hypothetical protein KJO53_06865 [Eudoraea sp.]|nr:hypothetical protein [Eudoraea sp.]MBT8291710.1 hypothetical protein [Eudoraea sp.]NNL02312.1 hypothetical protein [Eudoraea sp.]